MKKIFALFLALCMLAALCACGGDTTGTDKTDDSANGTSDNSSDSGNKVVTIGVYEPQSGDNGAGGKQEILGMQYANYVNPTVEINGETYDVKLVIADNESSTDKAVSAA